MPEQWYYSLNGQEQGPVTSGQFKELVASGVVAQSDLVWHEGMDDWAPAGQVKALLPLFTPTAPPSAARGDTAPQINTGRDQDGSSGRRPQSRSALPAVMKDNRAAQWLLMAGVVLVLTARGCDGLGNRNVQRLQAKSAAVEDQFNDEWEDKSLPIQAEIDGLADDRRERQQAFQDRSDSGDPPTAEDRQGLDDKLERIDEEIAEKKEEIAKITEEKNKKRREKLSGEWRDLRIASRDAARINDMWGYWREMLFVVGSQLLTIGLLIVGFNGQGAERWICLIMLAIITFSLYVGGTAWISSIRSVVGG